MPPMFRTCLALALCLLAACAPLLPQPPPSPPPSGGDRGGGATPLPTRTRVPPTATLTPTATPIPPRLYFAPGVPESRRARVRADLGAGYVEAQAPGVRIPEGGADVQVVPGDGPGGYALAEWVLVPVVPFPTIADDVAWADVQAFWAGKADALSYLGGGAPTLFVDADARDALVTLLGEPAPGVPLQVVPAADLPAKLWAARPLAWGIVPFDRLVPELKALTLDGQSVTSTHFDASAYPLRTHYRLDASPEVANRLDVSAGPWLNRDPRRLTVLMMTGVTALGRAIAFQMENYGVLYPDQKVRDILLDHDLLHISNEVSFADNCPFPDPNGDTTFCASPRYIDLLRDVGVDIVELSGNHNEDWGPEAALLSLRLYAEEGWPHFAGGWNDVDATTPLTVTNHGNTLVFLGCNPVGPVYAWAGPDYPGSAVCDYPNMYAQIGRARARGALPIVTWQYNEIYDYAPTPDQIADFRAMADAGAGLVSGSQAHHPQGFDFYGGAFIHYGLGNLFFDQMQELGTRQELVDQHVIYDGRLISTRVFTFMLENYAQPRPMTPAERAELLQALFTASGW
jgi:hypothetical protein